MRNADKDISGFTILLFQPCLQHVRKRSITGFISLYNLAASLIYRNDMIVFVNNLHDFKFMIYDLWIYDFAKQTSPT